ncbi:hypothetical protein J6590_064508 [Homalodisca vitripennis]|nr:hypothetical protein J6590_064508 [Homalodisca vitripennis]
MERNVAKLRYACVKGGSNMGVRWVQQPNVGVPHKPLFSTRGNGTCVMTMPQEFTIVSVMPATFMTLLRCEQTFTTRPADYTIALANKN